MVRQVLFGAALAVAIAGASGSATATPVNGPVDSSVFAAAGLNATSYSYVSVPTVFNSSGGGTLALRSSTYADSFGYSNLTKTVATPIFTSGAAVGTTVTINPTTPPFLFYFHTDGSGGSGSASDPAASVFTDYTKDPTSASQVDLAIYQSGNTYAFFFDDGGPSGCKSGLVTRSGNCLLNDPNDDNDYNDLVVTYTPTSTTVPEPVSLVLLGTGLTGVGLLRRAKQRA